VTPDTTFEIVNGGSTIYGGAALYSSADNSGNYLVVNASSVSAYGKSCPFSFILVARGKVVAEVYTQGFGAPGSKTAAMLEELFKRMPATDK